MQQRGFVYPSVQHRFAEDMADFGESRASPKTDKTNPAAALNRDDGSDRSDDSNDSKH
ncbi:protein of unknown function (plasmid) [Cupriavidus taiwanensis]|uniref:Uncharacterized protein n=1 Tax=Cupriavidus taiwanensis TaxID=164546 RepID=A0A375EDS2_9BURK|nr:protein of unknown function [Cupriavidus taiwanensis]SOZ72293.1 protein of unknown function [Cupriavidus taiwanensis]SOZ74581.1 protein of unknown function [Cupriavidus taiwanensis]